MIETVLYSDPACPWAYCESPALRVIEWRYGDQLDWRLVLIGLTEDAAQYEARGYTPLRGALGQSFFRRRYGMPFAAAPKARLSATARACRVVIAARIDQPGSEWRVFRALQLANFTTPLLLDDDDQLAQALARVPGLDGQALVSRIDDADVLEAYRQDKLQSRSAAGSAAELQDKTRITDGPVRFTAPSVTFQLGGTRLVAGGFQPVDAYDILVANLDPTLDRQPPPETPEPLLDRFQDGLTTQEVAALLAGNNEPPDRVGAEAALLELAADGRAVRHPMGDDALWIDARAARPGSAEVVGSAQASSNRSGSDSSP
jgi:2-hydroxychromene-2-carboxylate isomerase